MPGTQIPQSTMQQPDDFSAEIMTCARQISKRRQAFEAGAREDMEHALDAILPALESEKAIIYHWPQETKAPRRGYLSFTTAAGAFDYFCPGDGKPFEYIRDAAGKFEIGIVQEHDGSKYGAFPFIIRTLPEGSVELRMDHAHPCYRRMKMVFKGLAERLTDEYRGYARVHPTRPVGRMSLDEDLAYLYPEY